MNDHDDEVTTDVDPEWIAAIRAGTLTTPADGGSPDGGSPAETTDDARKPEPTDRVGEADWFDDESQWDAEATVGVSSGLIERIRAEIETDRGHDAALPAPPAVPPPATTDALAAPGDVTAATPLVPPTVPPTLPPNPPSAVPPPPSPPLIPPSPTASVDAPPTPSPVERSVPPIPNEDAASTTVRWEPRQRLAMTAPVKESAAIVDHSRHTGLDRTKVAIAVIVAVTLLLVVWLVSRAGGSDDPAPVGTVPAVSTPTVPPDGPDGAGAGG